MSGAGTSVFVLDAGACRALRGALNDAGYAFRSLQHAHFQARGEGVVVSCYRSGKVVVQGAGAGAFRERYLAGRRAKPARDKSGAGEEGGVALPPAADSLGSDEAGKGDTFGGLVVAAVAVPEGGAEELAATGVADSKTLSDARIRALAPFLREHYLYEERALEPLEYDQARTRAGSNVNTLLTQLHGDCLQALYARAGGRVAVVDRFSPRAPVTAFLRGSAPGLQVHEVPRAERHLAVAAASVLAREAFLCQMATLSERWAVDLPLGSGTPVARAMDALWQIHGDALRRDDGLRAVAKIHFKNVQDDLRRRG